MYKKDDAKYNPVREVKYNPDGTMIYEYENGLRLKYNPLTGSVKEVDEYGDEITEDD